MLLYMLRGVPMWAGLLLGCAVDVVHPKHVVPADTDSAAADTAVPTDSGSGDTSETTQEPEDTGPTDSGRPDTGDPPPDCAPPVVLAGSHQVLASEAWWTALLETLGCRGGEIGGGDVLEVGILTEAMPPDATIHAGLQAALEEAGFTSVRWFVASTPEEVATAADAIGELDAALLVPISAGDAYDAWNDTPLEEALYALSTERGGGIGGLGEGAMLLAGISLAGGQDYLSTHVMIDGHTTELDDASDGGSALHDDFLGLVPGAIVDVQMTGLGRLVRLAGAMARYTDETPDAEVWGIGLDAQSGLILQDGVGTVVGPGTVSVIHTTPESILGRGHWSPLTWTSLALDRLTAGWRLDVATGLVDTSHPPADAEAIDWTIEPPAVMAIDWQISGHLPEEEDRFGVMVTRSSSTFETTTGTAEVTLPGLIGMLDADFYEMQAVNHEALYRALHDHLGHTGVLVTYQGRLEHHADSEGRLRLTWNTPVPSRDDPEMLLERWEPSHVVVDTSEVSWRSLGVSASAHSSAIHPAGLIGLKLHLLAGSDSDGWIYDLTTRTPVRP
jgi:cyanophycinase-like exopeptidase